MSVGTVLISFAIALGAVTGGMAIVDEVFVPTYDLSDTDLESLNDTDLESLNEAAASGKRGLEGFQQTIKYPTGDVPYDMVIEFPSIYPSNYHPDEPFVRISHGKEDAEVTAPPVRLGEAFLSNASYDGFSSYTPTVDEHGSYVTSVQSTPESSYATKATMVLTNPSTDMFGDDGQASTEEMEVFYKSPQTTLVSFNSTGEVSTSYGEDKEACEVVLTLDGSELKTDAQDDCEAGLEVDEDEDFAKKFADRFLD